VEPLRIGLAYDDSLDRVGGIAQYLTTLGSSLARRGHRVTYLVGESRMDSLGGVPVHSLSRNVAVRFNGNRLSIPAVGDREAIDTLLAENDFDVLHVQMPYSPIVAGRLIRGVDEATAVVGTFHVASDRRLPKLGAVALARATARSLRRFDRIVSVSPVAAEFARATFGVTGPVVPNMVDLEAMRVDSAALAPVRGEPRIVFVGSLVPRKGVLPLLRAFEVLRASHRKATLTIAGDGPLRSRLERRVSRAGLAPAVDFLGTVSEADKARLLAGADIACFPSLFGESFGVVLLEAMAVGAGVVVGGRNPGHRAVLDAREESLVDPRDTAAFAARLEQLADDPDLRLSIRRSQRRIVARYDVDRVTDAVLAIYRDAIAARTGGQSRDASRADVRVGEPSR